MVEKHNITSIEQAVVFFKDFSSAFAFDTETTSPEIKEYARAHGRKAKIPEQLSRQALNYYYLEIEGMSMRDKHKAMYVDFSVVDLKAFLDVVRPVFENAKTIIGQNIVFDIIVLYKYGIDLREKRIYCTMVADHLIDENRPHGLKHMAKTLLGVEETMSYEEARQAGGKIFAEYAINDAIWTYDLCMYQRPLLIKDNLVTLFREIEMPFQAVLVDMHINGVEIDLEQVHNVTKEIREAKDKLSIDMHKMLNKPYSYQNRLFEEPLFVPSINFNSARSLELILFRKLKLESVGITANGQEKTGKEFLNVYKYTVPFVGLLAKYKIAEKLLSAFFEPLPSKVDGDGKVRASFKDTGTKTGRLSSSNPNCQQLPKLNSDFPVATRAVFIAGEGRKMFTVDFSNQEGRITAHLSNDETFIKQLLNGWDAHLATANASFDLGVPEEILSDNHPEHEMYKEKHSKMRSRAKSINFALPYGGTEFAISKSMGVSKEEAREAIQKYYTVYKGIRAAMDKAISEIKKTGTLTTMFGRKRRFTKVKGFRDGVFDYPQKAFRQAFNFKVQSSSADMMRRALIDTRELFKRNPEWDAKIIMTVHDEGVFTCKEEFIEHASTATKEVFEKCIELIVPIKASIGVGDDYEAAK